jgi:hypothetical protein
MAYRQQTRVITTSTCAFGLLTTLALISCGCTVRLGPTVVGSGVLKTEARDVPPFTALRVDSSAAVHITVGGQTTEVTVEADDNLLPIITTEVRGDTLLISSEGSYQTRRNVKVTIATPGLTSVVVNGSGDIVARGVRGDWFTATVNGSGTVTATGELGSIDARINGSGDLRLTELTARRASITIAGSGGASVNASESLHAHVSGSGDIRYQSHPQMKLNTRIEGSGNVKPL